MIREVVSGFNLLGKFAPILSFTSAALTAGVLFLMWNFLTPQGFAESLILIVLSVILALILFVLFFVIQFLLFLPYVLKKSAEKVAKGIRITIRKQVKQPVSGDTKLDEWK